MNNIIFNLIIKSLQLTELYLFVYLWRKHEKKKSWSNELLLQFIYFILVIDEQ